MNYIYNNKTTPKIKLFHLFHEPVNTTNKQQSKTTFFLSQNNTKIHWLYVLVNFKKTKTKNTTTSIIHCLYETVNTQKITTFLVYYRHIDYALYYHKNKKNLGDFPRYLYYFLVYLTLLFYAIFDFFQYILHINMSVILLALLLFFLFLLLMFHLILFLLFLFQKISMPD